MSGKFSTFSVLVALIAVVLCPISSAGEARFFCEAFSRETSDWHTVTIDLGSSVLVRIYGKILSEETPSDLSVTVGKRLYFLNAWIGDSKGNPVTSDFAEKYLVIEGTAANIADANDATIQEISYTVSGVRHTQFKDFPIELKAASGGQEYDTAGGGCSSGWGSIWFLTAPIILFGACRIRAKDV